MRRRFIPYNQGLREFARKLRNHSTLSEVLLWKELKGKKMMGYDFHRQKPIDSFIVDFYCPVLSLAIEVDGESHYLKEQYDAQRQRRIEKLGVQFLRFDDLDVKFRMDLVLKTIREWIVAHSSGTTATRSTSEQIGG